MANSFDTPRVMLVILQLVNTANAFLKDNKDVDLREVEAIARWITKMVGIFGIDANAKPPFDGLGWASIISEDVEPSVAVQPYAKALDTVKEDVRTLSLESDTLQELLAQDPTSEYQAIVDGGSRDIEQFALPSG